MTNASLKLVSIVSAVTVFAAGCSMASNNDAEYRELINEAFGNLAVVESSSFDLNFAGDIVDKTALDFSEASFDIDITGAADAMDPTAPNMQIRIGGEVAADADSGSFAVEMRITPENIYAIIEDASIASAIDPTFDAFAGEFIGKWWSMAVPAGTFEDVATNEEQAEEIERIVKESEMFHNIEVVGEEDVNGVKTTHYSAEIDREEMADVFGDLVELEQTPLTTVERQEMLEFLAATEVSMDVWVDEGEQIVRKMAGEFSFEDDAGSASFTMTGEFGDFNEPVEIEIPSETQEFDPLLLFGLGGF